jgi:putative salt-induced outer membrane protein YdiY
LISSDVLEIISIFVGNRNVMRVELRKVVHTKASSVSIGQYIKSVWLMGSLLLSTSIYSQTIINAEKLNSAKDSLAFSLELSYSGSRGNSVTDKIEFEPSFALVRKKNDFKLFGGYTDLSTGDKSHLNNGFVHIRHNYKLTTRLKTFTFYQIQFNEVLLLRKREVMGSGLRYALIKKDSISFDIGLGAMHESEFLYSKLLLLDEVLNTFMIRGAAVSGFEWIINKTFKLNNILYYQPYLKKIEDFRLLNDLSFTANITHHLNVTASLTFRYDSKPPSALTNFDSVMDLGIGYRFSK